MPVKDMRKTFQENREFVLGLIGEEWTRSTDIFSGGETKLITRHLKRLLEDELIIVNRVSRSEVYYKKTPNEAELNLSRLINSARRLMAEVKVPDAEYIEKIQAQIDAGMSMADLGSELRVFESQRDPLNECMTYLRRAYQGMGMTPLERRGWWESKRAFVMQEEIATYQAEGYELKRMRDDGSFLMEKVGTEGSAFL